MSYCRFSGDNFACDLYCYADVSGGYTTLVAVNRVLGEIPKEEPWPGEGASEAEIEAWSHRAAAAHRAQMDFLQSAERAPIGLPHDGAGFNDPDLESFLARVTSLRAMGYRVPDYVLDTIREEIADELNSNCKSSGE